MAALQIEVNGTAQNVARLISTDAPMNSASSLAGVNFLAGSVTNLINIPAPMTSTAFLASDVNFLGSSISNLVVVEGFGTSPAGGGGASEPVSKESWE